MRRLLCLLAFAGALFSGAPAFAAPTYGTIYLDHPANPAPQPWNSPAAVGNSAAFESALVPRVMIDRENTYTTAKSYAERAEASGDPWNSYGTFVSSGYNSDTLGLEGSGLASASVEPTSGAAIFSMGRYMFAGWSIAPWVAPEASYSRMGLSTGAHPATQLTIDNPSPTSDAVLSANAVHLADLQSDANTSSVPATSGATIDGSWRGSLLTWSSKGLTQYAETVVVAVKQDDDLYDCIVLFGLASSDSKGPAFKIVGWDQRTNQTWANVTTVVMSYGFGTPSITNGAGYSYQAWKARYQTKQWHAGTALPQDLGQDVLDSLWYGVDYMNLPDVDDEEAAENGGGGGGPLSSIDTTDLASFLDLPAGLLPDWFLDWINEHVIDPINDLAGQIEGLFWPVAWVNESLLGGAPE